MRKREQIPPEGAFSVDISSNNLDISLQQATKLRTALSGRLRQTLWFSSKGSWTQRPDSSLSLSGPVRKVSVARSEGKEAARSALGMTRPNRGHRTTPAVSRSAMKAKNPVLYVNTN